MKDDLTLEMDGEWALAIYCTGTLPTDPGEFHTMLGAEEHYDGECVAMNLQKWREVLDILEKIYQERVERMDKTLAQDPARGT